MLLSKALIGVGGVPERGLDTTVNTANNSYSGTGNSTVSRTLGAAQFKSKATVARGQKVYFEFLIVGANNPNMGIGNVNASMNPASPTWGYELNSVHIEASGGGIVFNSVSIGSISGSLAPGDVMGLAWDDPNGLLWARKNSGNWNNSGTANPATGAGGLNIAALSGSAGLGAGRLIAGGQLSTAGDVVTLRTVRSRFTLAVPGSFNAFGELP